MAKHLPANAGNMGLIPGLERQLSQCTQLLSLGSTARTLQRKPFCNTESLGLQGDPTVSPKGDQSWVFIGRTDAEAEAPILWLPDGKN